MVVEFAPDSSLGLTGRKEKLYIIYGQGLTGQTSGALWAAGSRAKKEHDRKGLECTRGRHWPMVMPLETGIKFPRAPQPTVNMRRVPRWTSAFPDSRSIDSGSVGGGGSSRPSSAASATGLSWTTSNGSIRRPRSAGSIAGGGALGGATSASQRPPSPERKLLNEYTAAAGSSGKARRLQRTASAAARADGTGMIARAQSLNSRPASASSVRSASSFGLPDDDDAKGPAADQLLREYRMWKEKSLEWQAPVKQFELLPHSRICMCKRCLGYNAGGKERLMAAVR